MNFFAFLNARFVNVAGEFSHSWHEHCMPSSACLERGGYYECRQQRGTTDFCMES